jgi:N4-gp56 family major capsid protein
MAYSPAGQLSTAAGLAHGVSAFYNRTALDNLYANTIFDRACKEFTLPRNNGKTVQFFRYDLTSVNTTANASEGTVGSQGPTIRSKILLCSVAQYDDFISTSDFNMMTSIDPALESYSRLLGIQFGLSVDTIIRGEFDAAQAATTVTLSGTSLKRTDLGMFRAKLAGANVKPHPVANGNYLVFVHPNITYDLTNDPTAGGWLDVNKTADPTSATLKKMDFQGVVGMANGCKVVETTNGYVSGTTCRTYAFGDDCAGIVKLAGAGPSTGIADPSNFKINMVRGGTPSIVDPTGVIGGIVSYKAYFGTCLLGGPAQIGDVYRFRTAETVTSVT